MHTTNNRPHSSGADGQFRIIACIILVSLAPIQGGAQETDIASLQAAAERGDPAAQHKLGLMLYRGNGVPTNKEAAAQWVERAAIQGLAPAQNDIAAFYHSGQGVSQDFEKAAVYYSLAAEQGHGFAALNIGGLFFNGQGMPKDSAQAAYWFTRAANSDDPKAAQQGQIWSDRLKERARLVLELQKERERNSIQPTQSEFEKGMEAGLIFLAIALVMFGGDGGGSSAPAYEHQKFEPTNICDGWGQMMEACGG